MNQPTTTALAPPTLTSAPLARPTTHVVSAVPASSNAGTAPHLVEFAERANAETVREMRLAHREELTRAYAELRRVRKQLERAQTILDEFETTVVEFDGKPVTLWSAYELGVGRQLCGVCRNEACPGCSVSDRELRAEYEMEAHDRE